MYKLISYPLTVSWMLVEDTRFLGQRQSTLWQHSRQHCQEQFCIYSQCPPSPMGVMQRVQMNTSVCSAVHYRRGTPSLGSSPCYSSDQQAWSLSRRKTSPHPSGLLAENGLIMSGQALHSWRYPARTCRDTQGPWWVATPNTRMYYTWVTRTHFIRIYYF